MILSTMLSRLVFIMKKMLRKRSLMNILSHYESNNLND